MPCHARPGGPAHPRESSPMRIVLLAAAVAAAGVVAPLDDMWEANALDSAFPQGIIDSAATYDGQKYAMPLNYHVAGMWYNPSVMESAGVAVPVETWDDLKAACESLKGAGVVPIALLGTEDFDIMEVDVASIMISRADGVGGGVAPLEGPPGPHSEFEDVGTPFDGDLCDCHELEGDGITDLSMKFSTQAMVEAMELGKLAPGEAVELIVTGELLDGTPLEGRDCIWLVPPAGGGDG